MYDRKVSVITTKLDYSKVPSIGTGTRYFFVTGTGTSVLFSKVPCTLTAVLLRSTVPTTGQMLNFFKKRT